MRVSSRLGASTTQADRGDPQLSTTLTGTTPSSVSVIVPAYNAAATLAEQLEALAAQRFDGDWELVIVDNGPPTVPRIWRGATGSASRSSH
jgi:cellulose synthase/poly-beta-1,6-N-acetylglucosamine synthase-like glycosyltransferase